MSYITELYLLLTNIIKGIINCCLRNPHPSPIHQSSILKFEDKICLENTLLVSKFLNSKAVSTDLLGVPTLLPLFNSATKGACKVNNFALVFGLIYYYHIRSSCLNDMISLYCHMPKYLPRIIFHYFLWQMFLLFFIDIKIKFATYFPMYLSSHPVMPPFILPLS